MSTRDQCSSECGLQTVPSGSALHEEQGWRYSVQELTELGQSNFMTIGSNNTFLKKMWIYFLKKFFSSNSFLLYFMKASVQAD